MISTSTSFVSELHAEALVHAAEVLLALGHADARRAVDGRAVHTRRRCPSAQTCYACSTCVEISASLPSSRAEGRPKFDFHTDES